MQPLNLKKYQAERPPYVKLVPNIVVVFLNAFGVVKSKKEKLTQCWFC